MRKSTQTLITICITTALFSAFVFSATKELAAEQEQKECLARNIYHEARGEPIMGQIAVAQVTLNRADDRRWPSSICEVVYQPKQFSWTHLVENQTPKSGYHWTLAQQLAEDVMNGIDPDNTDGAVYYHADYVNPSWNRNLTVTTVIGAHIFYKD